MIRVGINGCHECGCNRPFGFTVPSNHIHSQPIRPGGFMGLPEQLRQWINEEVCLDDLSRPKLRSRR
jgi:hypothetical protein